MGGSEEAVDDERREGRVEASLGCRQTDSRSESRSPHAEKLPGKPAVAAYAMA